MTDDVTPAEDPTPDDPTPDLKAIGDDAVAAGMDLVLGSFLANTLDTEVNKTRDYIAQRTSAVVPIAKGGTSSTTAPGARSALGITPVNIGAPIDGGGTGLRFSFPSFGRLAFEAPGLAFPTNIPLPQDIPAPVDTSNLVRKTGDVMTGDLGLNGCQLMAPAAYPAASGYSVAYLNVDGRLSKGASSRRYKKAIHNAKMTGGLFTKPLREFTLKADPGAKPHLGYIAEELVGTPLERFVIWDAEGRPEGIDYIEMCTAQVAEAEARIRRLEALVARLTGEV